MGTSPVAFQDDDGVVPRGELDACSVYSVGLPRLNMQICHAIVGTLTCVVSSSPEVTPWRFVR
jgi:hypothetical protein